MLSIGGIRDQYPLPKPASKNDFLDLNPLNGPRFLVTVDTEEEFDWASAFTRDQHGTTHVPAINRFQRLCDEHDVKPAYLIDYPIVSDPLAMELLGGYVDSGRAEIGVQLHPWVNPPFDEEVTAYNSFACNLPVQLERDKLSILYEKIVERIGKKPDMYRAGRYGARQQTTEILQDLGIAIDTSVRSRFDYSAQSGPDYSNFPINPYWLKRHKLIELPVTTVYGGHLQKLGPKLFRDVFGSDTSRSILSRTGLLERIALTPEGIPLDKAKIGIDAALKEGVGILNFSFHSPSLAAGNLSYTRTETDLEKFYIWWKEIFAYLAQRNIRAISPSEIKNLLVV
jgi:hypothetical protein